jgi:hypothetical protein
MPKKGTTKSSKAKPAKYGPEKLEGDSEEAKVLKKWMMAQDLDSMPSQQNAHEMLFPDHFTHGSFTNHYNRFRKQLVDHGELSSSKCDCDCFTVCVSNIIFSYISFSLILQILQTVIRMVHLLVLDPQDGT